MTPRQLSLICSAAYFNPPEETLRALYGGELTLKPLCEALLARADMSECSRSQLTALVQDPEVRELPILRYENKNHSSGMVAYALGAPQGGVICAFRGSESMVDGHLELTDWDDNFLAPFVGSIQYADIRAFIAPYTATPLMITGHSKGAHNALFALAKSQNPTAQCVCFDGQGFSKDALTGEERRSLRERAVNIVCETDIVGALLSHPERRVFTKKQGNMHPHELCSLTFSEDGEPVPGRRSSASLAIELSSALYVNGFLSIRGQRAPEWLVKLIGTADGFEGVQRLSF